MRHAYQSLLTIVLLLAVLVMGNFLSTRHFVRADLTEKGNYTLSAATRKMLDGVDDAITIKAYFSQKFPPALLPMRRDVEDLLAEIKASGHGLVTVEFLDPAGDDDLVADLEKLGVRSDPVEIVEKDQVQAVNVYKSIVLYHADKKEVVPSLTSVQDLEYHLAVAIKKLSLAELPTVAFLGFKDGPSTFDELAMLKDELKKLYDVDTAVVTGGRPIDDGVKTLVVIRPRGLSPREAYEVDQFLMRGGKAIFLVDGMTVDVRQNPPRPEPVTSGLEEVLAAVGVSVEKKLVFDPSCEMVRVQVRPGVQVPARYPPLVSAVFQFFNHESPLVSRISKIAFPWVSPLVLTEGRSGKEVIELIHSTDRAWMPAEPIELAPDKIPPPRSPEQVGSRLLAVALSGESRSAWADRPAPPPESPPDAKKPEPEQRSSGTTRVVVVGDSDFIGRDFLNAGGLRFFLNAVDWLTLDDSLIAIRTKSEKARPLPQMDDGQRRRFRILNYALAPIFITLFGIGRHVVRRRRQAAS